MCVRVRRGEPHSVLALLTHHVRDRPPPPPTGGEVGEAGWELEGSERVFPSLFSIAQLFSKRFQIILILIELFHMPADVKPRK